MGSSAGDHGLIIRFPVIVYADTDHFPGTGNMVTRKHYKGMRPLKCAHYKMHYFKSSRGDNRGLWENREALDKYMARLRELNYEIQQVIVINNLYYQMCGYSLGAILKSEMERREWDISELSKKCDIPVCILESLANDDFYPNSVPVLLFMELIRLLDIKENVVMKAIIRTFEILEEKKKKDK